MVPRYAVLFPRGDDVRGEQSGGMGWLFGFGEVAWLLRSEAEAGVVETEYAFCRYPSLQWGQPRN